MLRNKPSRRLKAFKQKKKVKGSNVWKKLIFISFLLVILLIVIFLPAVYWNGKSRVAMAVKKGESVALLVFDPVTDTITTFVLPENVEVEVSRQLGTWKLGSVWQLGQDENVGGSLLSETVTKTFHLPVETWGGEMAMGLAEPGFGPFLKALLAPYRTNITFKDRLGIGFFALSVKPSGKILIDMERAGVLNKTTLSDGETGYLVRDTLPSKISAVFADEAVSRENLNVVINYSGRNNQAAEEVGEIIQILGAKVTSLLPVNEPIQDCLVSGSKSLTRQRIARLFNCQIKNENQKDVVTVSLGEDFFRRY